jgi:hypothetical protein
MRSFREPKILVMNVLREDVTMAVSLLEKAVVEGK